MITFLSSILLFGFGYYIGNQIGKVAHVREQLHRNREQSIHYQQ